MFRRSSEPLALSEASLLVLRPALNTPVLNTDFLPVGPARAAIVVFAEEYGGIGLAIGVRSNEGGQIAVFRNQEPIDANTRLTDALEPALANAERMGFLFDEDIVESAADGQGRSQAMSLWGKLMGELEMPPPPATGEPSLEEPGDSAASLSNVGVAMPELLLDDLVPEELPEISLDLEDELEVIDPVAPPTPARPQLSRFRNAPPAPAEKTDKRINDPDQAGPQTVRSKSEGVSELGRIPLVRVRREGTKRVPFLARLLSSF
jgi:hypothetical protein